jgi:hypothetical protein
MNIASVLFFDEEAQNEIMRLWRRLYELDICKEMIDTNSRPHISLGAFSDTDLEDVYERALEYAKEVSKLKVSLTSISCFSGDGGVVYLAPQVTAELLEVHRKYYEVFADFDSSKFKIYTPPYWVPHCTMTIGVSKEKVVEGVRLLLQEFKPIEAKLSAIGFVEFYPISYRHDLTVSLKE